MDILTVDEAARLLRCTRQTLYGKIANKEIPCFRLGKGGHIRFERVTLLAWMRNQMGLNKNRDTLDK